jgi:hypothetical protein
MVRATLTQPIPMVRYHNLFRQSTEDLVGHSRLCDSSGYCSFKALSNAGQKRYRSLGLG